MTKRALTILVLAVLAVGGAAAVIAGTVTGGDSSKAQPVHTLQDGRVHTGPMPSGGHQMNDGQVMDGQDMAK